MARFGHTITPIGKDKAILFGGAVGDTGNIIIFIQENMLLQVILSSAIIIIKNGKNYNLKVILLRIVLHMDHYVLIIISLYMGGALGGIDFY